MTALLSRPGALPMVLLCFAGLARMASGLAVPAKAVTA